MGIVQVRNSDGQMEKDLTNTTYDLYAQYESDDHAHWLVDYIQQHVSVWCNGNFVLTVMDSIIISFVQFTKIV